MIPNVSRSLQVFATSTVANEVKSANLHLVQDRGLWAKRSDKNGSNPGFFRSLLHMAVQRGNHMSGSLLLFNTDGRFR